MAVATIRPRLSFDERLSVFTERLESALGGNSVAAVPAALFSDPSFDAHTWYRVTAERVAASFEAWGYAPDLDSLIWGMVDFSVRWTVALSRSHPHRDAAEIQAGMVELGILIVAKTYASDGTRHASRSTGNRLRNLYLEQMRPPTDDPDARALTGGGHAVLCPSPNAHNQR